MKPKFPTHEEAFKVAFDDFVEKGRERFFAGNFASHFYIQKLANGMVSLTLGGAGTVTNEDGTFSPVSAVNGSFNLPADAMFTLRHLMVELFPEDGHDGQD